MCKKWIAFWRQKLGARFTTTKKKKQPFPPGKVQEIEVAVRSAAQHTPAMLDIKHRVPFDDVTWHHGQFFVGCFLHWQGLISILSIVACLHL